MGWKAVTYAVVCAALALGLVAQAAELKSDHKKEEPTQTGPPIVLPRPPRPVRNPIADLVGRCQVLEGHHYRGLTVFPVQVRGYAPGVNPLTLDEALARNAVSITEKGAGQVPVLVLENRGGQYVFVMAGEILVGGKQNRILREDVLLPPHSGLIELPAYCVEEGRWTKRSNGFQSDGNVASSDIRLKAQNAAPQASVWSGVRETSKALRQESRSGDFNDVLKRGEVSRELGAYREEFCRVMPRRVVGMVVAQNGRFVGVDLFGGTSLFFRLRVKVLDSYSVGVLYRDRRIPAVPARGAAQQFLNRVLSASYRTQGTPGAGVIGRAVGNGVDAKGLVFGDRVIHMSMFPAVTILPVPIPR